MVQVTYYDILGVPMNANAAAIHRAYKERFAQWHPSTVNCDNDSTCFNPFHKIDQIRFKWLQRAYHILGNAVTRSEYDQHILECGLHPHLVKIEAVSMTTESEKHTNGNVEKLNDDHLVNNQEASLSNNMNKEKKKEVASTEQVMEKSKYASKSTTDNLYNEHIDPKTNSKYVYYQSPDGRAKRFEYYYNSENDPSLKTNVENAKNTEANDTNTDKSKDSTAITNAYNNKNNSNDEKEKQGKSKKRAYSANFKLPRRIRILEEQLLRIFQPVTNKDNSSQFDLLLKPVTSIYVLTEES